MEDIIEINGIKFDISSLSSELDSFKLRELLNFLSSVNLNNSNKYISRKQELDDLLNNNKLFIKVELDKLGIKVSLASLSYDLYKIFDLDNDNVNLLFDKHFLSKLVNFFDTDKLNKFLSLINGSNNLNISSFKEKKISSLLDLHKFIADNIDFFKEKYDFLLSYNNVGLIAQKLIEFLKSQEKID